MISEGLNGFYAGIAASFFALVILLGIADFFDKSPKARARIFIQEGIDRGYIEMYHDEDLNSNWRWVGDEDE